MTTVIAGMFFLGGAFFIFVAALGVLKFPDVYSRMHAVSKASSLGMGLILVGTTIDLGTLDALVKCALISIFIFLTTPVAAHMLGRAAYLNGARTWDKTRLDELKDFYKRERITYDDHFVKEPNPPDSEDQPVV
jgi:multicomponent Na+:H+ antiporter subunit G